MRKGNREAELAGRIANVGQALVMAHHSETEKVRKVCLSTIGLMLMGTPHMGSDLAAWSNLMDKLSRLFNTPMSNSFLRSNVSSSDENMAQLQIEFFQIVRERHSGQKIEIISFYEQLSTKGIGLVRELFVGLQSRH